MILKTKLSKKLLLTVLVGLIGITHATPAYAAFDFFKSKKVLIAGATILGGLLWAGYSYFTANEQKSLDQAQKRCQQSVDNFVNDLPADQRKRFDQDVAKITSRLEKMSEQELAGLINMAINKAGQESMQQPGSNHHVIQSIRVAQQENAECGYHAVINTAQAILPYTGCNMPNHTVASLKDLIKNQRETAMRKNLDPELTPEDVEAILNIMVGNQMLDTQEVEFLAKNTFHLPEPMFTVIGDITSDLHRTLLSRSTIDAIRNLQCKNGSTHGFIIGNMRHEENHDVPLQELQQQASGGHWISIVVRRENGTLHYDVRDSLNYAQANMVKALIDLVETDPDVLHSQAITVLDEEEAENRRARERQVAQQKKRQQEEDDERYARRIQQEHEDEVYARHLQFNNGN